MTTTTPAITYVIPCSGPKLATAAPAADLYTGPVFRHALAAARAIAAADEAAGAPARILVLSARYGLVELGQVIAPYDTVIDGPGCITPAEVAAQAEALGLEDGEVYGLLPRAYLRLLDLALRELFVYVQDVYEATAGVGEQRHVNAVLLRGLATAGPVFECDGCGRVGTEREITVHVLLAARNEDGRLKAPADVTCWGGMEVGEPAWLAFHRDGVPPMAAIVAAVATAYTTYEAAVLGGLDTTNHEGDHR